MKITVFCRNVLTVDAEGVYNRTQEKKYCKSDQNTYKRRLPRGSGAFSGAA